MAGIEKVIFMNMCMVYDKEGNVVALDKVGKGYSGTTFPGGHVETGETFKESVIREIYEETGLTIQNPRLTGIYHWMTGDIRNVGFYIRRRNMRENWFPPKRERSTGFPENSF